MWTVWVSIKKGAQASDTKSYKLSVAFTNLLLLFCLCSHRRVDVPCLILRAERLFSSVLCQLVLHVISATECKCFSAISVVVEQQKEALTQNTIYETPPLFVDQIHHIPRPHKLVAKRK